MERREFLKLTLGFAAAAGAVAATAAQAAPPLPQEGAASEGKPAQPAAQPDASKSTGTVQNGPKAATSAATSSDTDMSSQYWRRRRRRYWRRARRRYWRRRRWWRGRWIYY
jgi:hypothetical protein